MSRQRFRKLTEMQTLSSRFQFFYTAQSSLGYSIGNLAQGMANNGMSDEQRRTLPAGSPEYHMRVLGSQIQVAGWTVYSMLIWALKLSMLTFYTRLTSGLGRPFRIRINIGFALVLSTFVAALLSIFTACRPFGRYWQINPNPGSKQREMTRNPCSVSPLTFFFCVQTPVRPPCQNPSSGYHLPPMCRPISTLL